MDLLITILLIVIGFAVKNSKNKKKKNQKAQQAGFQQAFSDSKAPQSKLAKGAKAVAKEVLDLSEDAESAFEQLKIPYTKEEWSKFLKENDSSRPKEAARKRAEKAILRSGDSSLISQMQPARPAAADGGEGQEFEKLAAERLRPDARHLEGESHREHAAHRARIAEEEARLHREREELQELRNVNLKKLRTAVVMSEVLGKPVALRGRR